MSILEASLTLFLFLVTLGRYRVYCLKQVIETGSSKGALSETLMSLVTELYSAVVSNKKLTLMFLPALAATYGVFLEIVDDKVVVYGENEEVDEEGKKENE